MHPEIIKLTSTESTNKYALELLKSRIPEEFSAVVAGYQTSGKGQPGNIWISEENKNLLVSVFFYPEFLNPSGLFLLNQFISLAIVDFLIKKLENHKIFIKWPNDIIVEGRKICGILINNISDPNRIKISIAGIGINVNQTGFPDNITNATSMKLITGKSFSLDECLTDLLYFLRYRYLQLKNNEFEVLKEDYNRQLFLYKKKSIYKDKDNFFFEGTINGVQPDGRLELDVGNKILVFNFKEISFVEE